MLTIVDERKGIVFQDSVTDLFSSIFAWIYSTAVCFPHMICEPGLDCEEGMKFRSDRCCFAERFSGISIPYCLLRARFVDVREQAARNLSPSYLIVVRPHPLESRPLAQSSLYFLASRCRLWHRSQYQEGMLVEYLECQGHQVLLMVIMRVVVKDLCDVSLLPS